MFPFDTRFTFSFLKDSHYNCVIVTCRELSNP